jgi:para-aminobenzoate synthetase component I
MGWRVGDPGDPAELAAAFLARFGLVLPVASDNVGPPRPHEAGEICGAVILISAAAGAVMIGGPVGPPGPAPDVPDVAVVVYAHGKTIPGAGAFQPGGREFRLGAWQPSWSPGGHAAAVAEVRAAISRGDVYQVNVVGHAAAPYDGDPMPALSRVTALPGAHHRGLITGDGWAVASGSPEMLVRVEGGTVETRPIKGTRPATADGRRELLASAKERAEHVMIVDLERNDLAHVARTGTVEVPELFAVRRWCDLWQAESRVVARLADGIDLATLLRAVCPGGSVTGAPKLAALAQIAALEPVGRGPSMGALGWLDAERLTLGLTIRTVAVDGDRIHLWTGGGVTWDSDPQAEVAEAAAKAAPVRAALAGTPARWAGVSSG